MPLSPTRRGLQQHAPALAAGGLVLAMGVSLAWQSADWLRLLQVPAAPAPSASQPLAPEFDSLPLANLFGGDDSIVHNLAPADDLGLTLLGSFVHAEPNRSSAIIRSRNQPAQRFQVGSEVVDGIRLRAVHADHVALQRNGQQLNLSFPRTQATPSAASANSSAGQAPLGEPDADNLAQLRERMDALREQMEAAGALPAATEPTDQLTESD